MSDFAPITTIDGFSVKELAHVSPDLLCTKDMYRRIKMLVYEMLIAGEPWDASELSRILEEKLALVQKTADNRRMFKEYTAIAYSLPFLYLLSLDTKELEELFTFNLASAFRLGIDVLYYTADLFKIMGGEEEVLALQNIIIQALHKNTEEIGRSTLRIGRDTVRPELRLWFSDYDSHFEGRRGPLQEVEYFAKSENAKTLAEEEKELLQKVIRVYDFIRYPSLERAPESWELPPPPFAEEILPAQEESARRTDAATNLGLLHLDAMRGESRAPNAEVATAYNTLPIQLPLIWEKVNELRERLAINPHIVTQILQNPQKVRDKVYVVAALLLQIPNSKFQIPNKDELKNFIRTILETKLGWNTEDSAKLGIRVSKMLGESYRGWAYYNKETGRFEWANG